MSPPEGVAAAAGPRLPPPESEITPTPSEMEALSAGVYAAQYVRSKFNVTDVGNGQRFGVRYHKDVKYCHLRQMWYLFDGTRWKPDRVRGVRELAKNTAVAINTECATEPNEDRRRALQRWARDSEGISRINAMLDMASTMPGISITPDELDANPDLFNLQNGTFNVRTLEVTPHNRDDLITKVAGVAYDPEAKCPRWLAHLELIFDGDTQMIDMVQELLGYALIAGNPLQLFPIWWGSGENGKSVTITTICSIFGDYAVTASTDVFMSKPNNHGPRPEVLALRDSRLAVAVEIEKGARLNEALIKQMTGGDMMTVRGLYSNDMESFVPSHLGILVTNPRPDVKGREHAIWRRIVLCPFNNQIPEDKKVVDYERVLIKEASGIFNWIVEGLRRYYAQGNKVVIADAARKATKIYKDDMGVIGNFIKEMCVLEERVMDRQELYGHYVKYCKDNGDECLSPRAFADALKEHGVTDGGKSMGKRKWRGIRMRTDTDPDTEEA